MPEKIKIYRDVSSGVSMGEKKKLIPLLTGKILIELKENRRLRPQIAEEFSGAHMAGI